MISLTAREFSVLEFLVRRSGLVVSKSHILDGYSSSSAPLRTLVFTQISD